MALGEYRRSNAVRLAFSGSAWSEQRRGSRRAGPCLPCKLRRSTMHRCTTGMPRPGLAGAMFATTHTPVARWVVANANDKRSAWINAILHVPPAPLLRRQGPRGRRRARPGHGGATRPGRAQPTPSACRGAPMTTVQRPTTPLADGGGRPLLGRLPGLRTLLSYQPAWLPRDLVAGLVLTALLVLAGMGYARPGAAAHPRPVRDHRAADRLRPVRPELILVLGPDSNTRPADRGHDHPLAAGDPEQAVALAVVLAVMAGVLRAAGLLASGSSPTCCPSRCATAT